MALGAVVVLGKTLYITDNDLEDALGQVGLTSIFRWILRYTGSTKRAKADIEAEEKQKLGDSVITAVSEYGDGQGGRDRDKDSLSSAPPEVLVNEFTSINHLSEASLDNSLSGDSLDDSYHHEQQGWIDKGGYDHDHEHHNEFHEGQQKWRDRNTEIDDIIFTAPRGEMLSRKKQQYNEVLYFLEVIRFNNFLLIQQFGILL